MKILRYVEGPADSRSVSQKVRPAFIAHDGNIIDCAEQISSGDIDAQFWRREGFHALQCDYEQFRDGFYGPDSEYGMSNLEIVRGDVAYAAPIARPQRIFSMTGLNGTPYAVAHFVGPNETIELSRLPTAGELSLFMGAVIGNRIETRGSEHDADRAVAGVTPVKVHQDNKGWRNMYVGPFLVTVDEWTQSESYWEALEWGSKQISTNVHHLEIVAGIASLSKLDDLNHGDLVLFGESARITPEVGQVYRSRGPKFGPSTLTFK